MESLFDERSFSDFQDELVSLKNYRNSLSRIRIFEIISLSLKILLMEERVKDVYLNSFSFSSLKSSYDEVVKRISLLFKELEITDPVSVFSVYSYLIKNGYLSYRHNFVYSRACDDCLYLFGSNVIHGVGVCRHIASFLTDIYKELGYVSCNISTVYKEYPNLSHQKFHYVNCGDARKKSFLERFLCVIISGGNYNHLVTLVNSNSGTLVIDATNDCVYFVDKMYSVVPLLKREDSILCDYQEVFNFDISDRFSRFLEVTDLRVLDNIKNIYDNAWNFSLGYSSLFEEFYIKNKDLYKDIVDKRLELVRELNR